MGNAKVFFIREWLVARIKILIASLVVEYSAPESKPMLQ